MNKYYINIENFSVQATDNPDLMKFSATVGYLDTPTDATPCGGMSGYKTVISSEGTDVQTLVGMGVNCDYGWGNDFKGHDKWFKIGTITSAWMQGNEIKAEGHLWKADFPDICDTIECAKDSLGCSVELYFESVEEDKANKNIIGKNAHFTGVAILYKSKAAFQRTSIMCAIKQQEEDKLNEEIQKVLDEQNKKVEGQFAAMNEAIAKIAASVEALSTQNTQNAQTAQADATDAGSAKCAEAAVEGFDFEALSKAIVDGVTAAFEKNESNKADSVSVDATADVQRKTVSDFGTQAQDNKAGEKTLMELCAEVDADKTLTDGQKWAKKLSLWNAENNKA